MPTTRSPLVGPAPAGPAALFLLALPCLWGCNDRGTPADESEGPSLLGLTEDGGGELLCGSDFFVSLFGDDLVFTGDVVPTLTLTDANGALVEGEVMELSVQPDCTPVEGLEDTVRCEQVFARLPLSPYPQPYVSELTFTNPEVEGYSGSATLALTVLPGPSISSVSPSLASFQGDAQEVEVSGSFVSLSLDGTEALPEVFLADSPGSPLEVLELADCSDLDLSAHDIASAELCSTLTVRMTEPGDLGVRNPSVLGCESQEALHGVGEFPGDDYELVALNPMLICDGSAGHSVQLSGVSIYRVGEQDPGVTVDGLPAQVTLDDCELQQGMESCQLTTIDVPTELESLGAVDVVITHPAPLDVPFTLPLWVQPAFALERATPSRLSAGQGDQQVVLTTSGFLLQDPVITLTDASGGTVTLDAELPEQTLDGEPNCELVNPQLADGSVCFEVEVTVPAEVLTEGYTPTLSWETPLGDGCNGSSSSILTIDP